MLSEQVRMIRDEEVLATGATAWDAVQGWKDQKTVNVTLTEPRILYVWMRTDVDTNDGGVARALLDGVPVVSSGYFDGDIDRDVFIVLPAGSYVVKFQTSCHEGTGSGVRLQDTKVALLNFPDKQRETWDSGSVPVAAATEETVLNEDFTVPATRKLAVGSIKKYVCIVTVYGWADAGGVNYAVNRHNNPGESNVADMVNWKIFLDDVQVSWTERNADKGTVDHNAPGSYGRYVVALDPSTVYNLKLKAYNGCGSSRNCRAYVDVVLCPWFLSDVDYEPVSLDFPQGSTLYVVLEPLNTNPMKAVRIGRVRFMSFGTATDYYASEEATGIIVFDYTFEIVEVVNSILSAKGFGGCISVLGVDVQ